MRRRALARWGPVRAAPGYEGREEGRGSPTLSAETLASHSDQLTSGGGPTSLRRCARGGYFSQGSNIIDLKSAYLNAPMDVDVYVQQPEGFEEGPAGTVARLLYAFFG